MSESVSYTLQEYRIQREYREQKRKQYLKKFQFLKQKLNQPQPVVQANLPEKIQKPLPVKESEEEKLMEENLQLRAQLQTIEKEERQKLAFFKEQISSVKGKYIERIKEISQEAKKTKEGNEAKIKKLAAQITAAKEKNQQIEGVNGQLSKETQDAESMMQKYTNEIKNEYGTKLNDFEEIFKNSNEKIEAMQAEMNEEEFIENTLNNDELMKTLKENAEKGGEDIDKIIEEYNQLLNGKKQILQEIQNNNQMKEKEISKMSELEGKLKVIFDKLAEEKKIYLAENNKMAEELMQVRQLLTASMGEVPQ